MKCVAEKYRERLHQKIENVALPSDDFFKGKLGLLWYCYNLWKVKRGHTLAGKIRSLIDELFAQINTNPNLAGASFANGVTGFGYVMAELHKEGFLELDIDNEFPDLDQYLYDQALLWVGDDYLDFFYGTTGILHYFSQRLGNPQIQKYTTDVVERMLSKAIRTHEGLWFQSYVNDINQKELINLGLAHGLTGQLIVLMNIYENGLPLPSIIEAVEQGVKFLKNAQCPVDYDNDRISFFPTKITAQTNEYTFSKRLAWCYGDLNVVLCLYRASVLLKDASLNTYAEFYGLRTLMRTTPKDTLVEDSHFCHGAAGLAMLYKSLYDLSGHEAYQQGYFDWIDRLMVAIENDFENNTLEPVAGSLLCGYLGPALALLTFSGKETLRWQKAFLL
jgi:lantibiotic biosynthesis protein